MYYLTPQRRRRRRGTPGPLPTPFVVAILINFPNNILPLRVAFRREGSIFYSLTVFPNNLFASFVFHHFSPIFFSHHPLDDRRRPDWRIITSTCTFVSDRSSCLFIFNPFCRLARRGGEEVSTNNHIVYYN